MKVKITCPLGSECETIVDNELCRCAWYIDLRGVDEKGEETSEKTCTIPALAKMGVRGIIATNGIQASIESGRNTIVKLANGAKKLESS